MLRFHRFRAWLDVYHHKFVLEATCPKLMKYAKRCTGLKAAFYMAKCHANRNDMHNLWVIMRSNRDRVLAIGETWTYTYSYTVNQVDVDKKQVVNMVHAKTDELPDGVETTLTISLSSKPVPPEEKSSDVPKTGESGTNLGGGLMLLLLALALIVWKKRKVNRLWD